MNSITDISNPSYKLSDLDSNRINILKTILIILVLFIHNKSFQFTNNFFSYFEFLFSKFIATGAVPLFFLLSGYLQELNPKEYGVLIKKRFKSLGIPYIFWNVVGITIYSLIEYIILHDTEFQYISFFLKGISGIGMPEGKPYTYQLWFLRDLIILVFSGPIIKKILNNFSFEFLVFSFTLLYLDINLYVISNVSLFFFSLGMYLGKNKINFFREIDKLNIIVYLLGGIFISIVFFLKNDDLKNMRVLEIFLSSVFLLRLSFYVNTTNYFHRFSKYSFFIYLTHEPFLLYGLQRFQNKYINNELLLFICYFGNIFLVVFILVLISSCLRKILPKFYYLIVGGR